MKILVQWALETPEDWDEVDSSDWVNLPKGPVPSNHTVNNKLWIHALNIQGIVFMGYDHYAIEEILDGVNVTCWNDDPDDWAGNCHAEVWQLLEPAFDVKVNTINTRQSVVVFAEQSGDLPWVDFRPPDESITRHGILVTDELNDQLITKQSIHGWREWIGH